MTCVRKTGDWAKARALLAAGPSRAHGALQASLRSEAKELQRAIVQGLTKQAPGGRELESPSSTTLAARQHEGARGRKALVASSELKNAVKAIVRGDKAFVGVPRNARGTDGSRLADIAEVQEFGSRPTVVPMTAAMRRFLFATLKEAGETPRGGSGRGVVVIQVPARPFLRPAFEAFKRGAQARLKARVVAILKLGGLS